ncbi:MAG TPA: hypothetical protein VEC12_03935 [Bacteroidia bacterium]|nr:hypothetical protein [Bacteroidia bacterium]
MKNLKIASIIILLVWFALEAASCKRKDAPCYDPANPKCVDYDPCYGTKPVIAEIKLSQRAAPSRTDELGKLYIDEQNIFPQVQIKFDTPLEGAKYTWILGTETITTKSFERHFFTAPFGTYSVKLIVEKEPNKNCYPTDDGKDTLVKTFQIVPICQLQSSGVFKGKWENTPDSAIITVRTYNDGSFTDSCNFGITRFINLQGINDTIVSSCIISNPELINYDPGTIPLGNLNLKINPVDKSVVIDYFMFNERRIFRGRKIAN